MGWPSQSDGQSIEVYRVKRFKEKPDLETARRFLASGDHLWNSGIFIWKVSALMEAMERHMPILYEQLQAIDRALGTSEESAVLAEVWQGVQNISVDIGVLEKADNVVVIPLQVGWNDVGSWAQLCEILRRTRMATSCLAPTIWALIPRARSSTGGETD